MTPLPWATRRRTLLCGHMQMSCGSRPWRGSATTPCRYSTKHSAAAHAQLLLWQSALPTVPARSKAASCTESAPACNVNGLSQLISGNGVPAEHPGQAEEGRGGCSAGCCANKGLGHPAPAGASTASSSGRGGAAESLGSERGHVSAIPLM